MAATTQAVKVLTTLEYLGTYPDPKGSPGIQFFGVIVQVGAGDGATITADMAGLLQPWMWCAPGNQPPAPNANPIPITPPVVRVWQVPGTASTVSDIQEIKTQMFKVSGTLDGSIPVQLREDCKAAIANNNLAWVDPRKSAMKRGDGMTMYPWPAHLAQVSRYPYPIPHLLNLCFLMQVTDSWKPPVAAGTQAFATVEFTTFVGPNPTTYKPTFDALPKSDRIIFPLIADGSVVIATQPLTSFTGVPSVISSSGQTGEAADWQAHLPSGAADLFDLSDRIVTSVRRACEATSSSGPDAVLKQAVSDSFNVYTGSVLTAQREIVAYGCRRGPSGRSLLERLLDQWVNAKIKIADAVIRRDFSGRFLGAVQAQRDLDVKNYADANDRWLALLKSNPAFSTNPLVVPPSIPSADSAAYQSSAKYPKGSLVVYRARWFAALQDSPKTVPGVKDSGADWQCLAPALSIFDSKRIAASASNPYSPSDRILDGTSVYKTPTAKPATEPPNAPWSEIPPLADPPPDPYDPKAKYKKGDVVLFGAKRYSAPIDSPSYPPEPIPTDKSKPAWHQLVAANGINPDNLSDRLLAVEQLQTQFAQDSILVQLLTLQWQRVFDAAVQASAPGPNHLTAADLPQLQSFLSNASAALSSLDVRGALLQGNLDASWSVVSKNLASRDTTRKNLKSEFNARISALFQIVPGGPADKILGAPLNKWLDTTVAARINALIPDPLPQSAGGTAPAMPPTRTSQGLSVVIDSLQVPHDDANPQHADDTDPLRSKSGVCVLIRPNGPNTWQCLNAGIPMVGNPAKPALTNAVTPLIIPLPIHDQDGLRRATLTYNNQPLMCSSPAHRFGDGLVPAQNPAGNSDRLISFQHSSVQNGLDAASLKDWKIPGLGFKRAYDFLLGSVSNSAALPAVFTDAATGPAVFSFASVAVSKPAATIANVPYLRTVPVSDLRFFSSLSGSGASAPGTVTIDKLQLPAIPSDVQPRAEEVFPTELQSSGTTPGRQCPPLVMLSCYPDAVAPTSQFTLSVRRPTADFLTWDRTQAALDTSTPGTPSQIRTDRTHAWTLFHYLARQQQSNSDLALEDRAVGSLTIQLDGVWSTQLTPGPIKITSDGGADANEIAWNDSVINVPNPSSPTTKVETPGDPIALKFITSSNPGAATTAKRVGSSWEITLPPGSVTRIQLTSKLKPGLDQHFAKGILDGDRTYTLLVETANQAMPSRSDLYSAFDILPPLQPDTKSVNFNLALPAAPDSTWAQVSRVDLQSQVWRWDGRPSGQFPFSTVAPIPYGGQNPVVPKQPPSLDLLNWELDAYAVRRATDLTTRPMKHVQIPAPVNGSIKKKGQVSTASPITVFQASDDRATELGATYYRAGVTVYNRYGSLVPPGTRSVSSLNKDEAAVPGADGNWTRRFIPARITADASAPADYKPPKPAIKYIVPLTGATTATQPAASSVLVVVQGPWYAIAGLAEDISASITQSATPVAANDPVPVPEAGADPILFNGPRANLPTTFDEYGPLYPSEKVQNPLFHGPVGHTFDQSDVNPLWVTSSFVLDPPGSNKVPAQEGTFARVQFTRRVHRQGVVVQDATAILSVPSADFESEPTDPVWVQFLPSRFLPLKPSFDELSLSYDAPSKQVSIVDDAMPICLTLNSYSLGSNLHLLLFGLLLTQQVNDMLGRLNQERFIDLQFLKPSANEETTAIWANFAIPKGVAATDLIGRIVVIQRQVDTTTGCGTSAAQWPCDLTTRDELWKEMFPGLDSPSQKDSPDQKNSDAVARIVAVSPPIPATDVSKRLLTCVRDTSLPV